MSLLIPIDLSCGFTSQIVVHVDVFEDLPRRSGVFVMVILFGSWISKAVSFDVFGHMLAKNLGDLFCKP